MAFITFYSQLMVESDTGWTANVDLKQELNLLFTQCNNKAKPKAGSQGDAPVALDLPRILLDIFYQ